MSRAGLVSNGAARTSARVAAGASRLRAFARFDFLRAIVLQVNSACQRRSSAPPVDALDRPAEPPFAPQRCQPRLVPVSFALEGVGGGEHTLSPAYGASKASQSTVVPADPVLAQALEQYGPVMAGHAAPAPNPAPSARAARAPRAPAEPCSASASLAHADQGWVRSHLDEDPAAGLPQRLHARVELHRLADVAPPVTGIGRLLQEASPVRFERMGICGGRAVTRRGGSLELVEDRVHERRMERVRYLHGPDRESGRFERGDRGGRSPLAPAGDDDALWPVDGRQADCRPDRPSSASTVCGSAKTAAMSPSCGRLPISRARSANNSRPSSRLKTPETTAAAYSPTL